jgi:hypothetical protein
MVKLNQRGAVSGTIISLGLAVLLLIAAIAFGGWAYSSRQDYKNKADIKIAAAVQAAKQQQTATDNAAFAQASKDPLKSYSGPEAYGSLVLDYPKTWSGYVDDSGTGNALVDGYFSPGVVPAISGQNSVFALRLQVLSQSYSQTLQAFQGQQQSGQLTVAAYALPKLPQVVGVEVTGQISGQGSPNTTMVVLPLRSYTIEISTQGNQYLADFNNSILSNFSFSP